jgi:hypothetical protein
VEPLNVTACLVTRGDVPLEPILETFPPAWQVMVYDNSKQAVDMAVYGRYRAVVAAHSPVVYVQDDDVLVSEPQAIVDALLSLPYEERERTLVANMPAEFRPHYDGHALVGFGAAFMRDLPAQVFAKTCSRSSSAGRRCSSGPATSSSPRSRRRGSCSTFRRRTFRTRRTRAVCTGRPPMSASELELST